MLGEILALHPQASAALVAAYQMALAGKEPPPMAPRGARPYAMRGDVAVISVKGFMAKASSPLDQVIMAILGGTDTAQARAAVIEASAAPDVRAIVLHVNSPGGLSSGTGDLADAVFQARARKPVLAFVEDLAGSAAYYVASQADSVAVNASGLTGSIGTYGVLLDLSGAAAEAGIRVHVISSTPLKGAGVDGAPVLPEQLAEFQRIVNGLAGQFVQAVARGRGVPEAQARTWADGRLHFAEDARRLGLVDGIGTFEQTLAAASLRAPSVPQRTAAPVPPKPKTAHELAVELERLAVSAHPRASKAEALREFCRRGEGASLYRSYQQACLDAQR